MQAISAEQPLLNIAVYVRRAAFVPLQSYYNEMTNAGGVFFDYSGVFLKRKAWLRWFQFATSFFVKVVVYCTVEKEVRRRCLTISTHRVRFLLQYGSC